MRKLVVQILGWQIMRTSGIIPRCMDFLGRECSDYGVGQPKSKQTFCTFGPILKALLQDQIIKLNCRTKMFDRSLKSLPYIIDHKPRQESMIYIIMGLSDCVE